MHKALQNESANIIVEGANALMLDIDFGELNDCYAILTAVKVSCKILSWSPLPCPLVETSSTRPRAMGKGKSAFKYLWMISHPVVNFGWHQSHLRNCSISLNKIEKLENWWLVDTWLYKSQVQTCLTLNRVSSVRKKSGKNHMYSQSQGIVYQVR